MFSRNRSRPRIEMLESRCCPTVTPLLTLPSLTSGTLLDTQPTEQQEVRYETADGEFAPTNLETRPTEVKPEGTGAEASDAETPPPAEECPDAGSASVDDGSLASTAKSGGEDDGSGSLPAQSPGQDVVSPPTFPVTPVSPPDGGSTSPSTVQPTSPATAPTFSENVGLVSDNGAALFGDAVEPPADAAPAEAVNADTLAASNPQAEPVGVFVPGAADTTRSQLPEAVPPTPEAPLPDSLPLPRSNQPDLEPEILSSELATPRMGFDLSPLEQALDGLVKGIEGVGKQIEQTLGVPGWLWYTGCTAGLGAMLLATYTLSRVRKQDQEDLARELGWLLGGREEK